MSKDKNSTKFVELLKDPRWIWAVIVIAVVGFVLLYVSEGQFPNIPLSSGIVAFISAVIGVILTIVVTHALLNAQTKSESERDKDVRVFQKKIQVYSKFSSEIWNFFYEYQTMNENVKDDNYEKLRIMCFDELVFFLEKEDIKQLIKVIEKIKPGGLSDNYSCICEITNILQDSLYNKNNNKEVEKSEKLCRKPKREPEKEKRDLLRELYEAFDQKDKSEKPISKPQVDEFDSTLKDIAIPANDMNITFWHFNMLGDEQIKAFEKGNWVLNLNEYGEDWRTKSLEQVKKDDVVFLFRRGGFGYLGAFRVKGQNILNDKNKYTDTDIEKYDIYNALADGASYSSNLIVEPIAYNFKGVGCLTVRRRTIERMNDAEAIKFLLNRFSGKVKNDQDPDNLGMGKLDENTNFELKSDYLNKISKNYLK